MKAPQRIWRKSKQGGWLLFRGGGRRSINLVISANTSNYNAFVAAGSPTDPVDVTITINSGVTVIATNTTVGAVNTGVGWAATTTFKIINNGNIYGAGGPGGSGGSVTALTANPGTKGADGGPAVDMYLNVTIDNTNGNVWAGGGGGGGGGASAGNNPPLDTGDRVGGTGGSGGQGGTGGNAANGGGPTSNNGDAGSQASPGVSVGGLTVGFCTGGFGGAGGNWGGNGNQGGNGSGGILNGARGGAGAGGPSFRRNGFTVTIVGGNNGTQIKGVQA